jgi:hypothetical protein
VSELKSGLAKTIRFSARLGRAQGAGHVERRLLQPEDDMLKMLTCIIGTAISILLLTPDMASARAGGGFRGGGFGGAPVEAWRGRAIRWRGRAIGWRGGAVGWRGASVGWYDPWGPGWGWPHHWSPPAVGGAISPGTLYFPDGYYRYGGCPVEPRVVGATGWGYRQVFMRVC